jgi:hypothetical protein
MSEGADAPELEMHAGRPKGRPACISTTLHHFDVSVRRMCDLPRQQKAPSAIVAENRAAEWLFPLPDRWVTMRQRRAPHGPQQEVA